MTPEKREILCAVLQIPGLFSKIDLERPRAMASKAHRIADEILRGGDPAYQVPVAGEYKGERR